MKTSCKSKENCQVELTVTLDADEVGAAVKDVERVFMREAQIPGFRKGKVPIQIIRKEFASGLKEETERSLIRKYYADAVKAEGLEEVALAGAKDISYDANGGAFTAIVEVKPKFKLPTYKGLKVEAKDTKVSDGEVQAQLDRLRVAYAKYENAAEGEAVADGDFVEIDYSGTVDGKPILEINPEAKVVAEGKGFWTQVEEGRFLPEILDAVKGMKAGETKTDVKAKFDKESAPEGLKGAKATINRSKGLGENDPDMMWMTTMNPETRRLIKVMPEDAERMAEVFDLLLGDNLEGRKNHISEFGAQFLDLADIS